MQGLRVLGMTATLRARVTQRPKRLAAVLAQTAYGWPAVIIAALTSTGWAQAQNPDSQAAYVTASTGTGAARADTGERYSTNIGGYFDDENSLQPGQRVVTGPDGTATITLPEFATIIQMGASSEVSMERQAGLEGEVPLSCTVHKGAALVVRRENEDRWFLIAGAGQGYALLQGGSLGIRVAANEVTFAAAKGTSQCYRGAVPGGPLIGATDKPTDATGITLSEGQSVSTATWAPTSDRSADTMVSAMTRDLFAFAVTSGGDWIKDAEEGDLTPVRGAGRGTPELLRGELTSGLAFDQPRSIVATPTSRAVTQPIRTTPSAISVTQARLESGIPTSVVIGQRLRRTRIIGGPGTSGAIRFNPNAEQLIRLPGR